MSVIELPGQARDAERTPPQDINAEQSVLGGMLLSKDAIADVVEVLHGHDFYRPAHQTVYDVILDLYGRGEPADAITVAAELTKRGEIARVGGAAYLHTLMSSVPTAANAGYYARIVGEKAVLRRLVEAGTRIVQLGYAGNGGDVDEIVDRAQAAIYDVTERRTADDYSILESLLQPTMDEIEASGQREAGLTGVPTGFNDLDALTNGLHPGQLIVVAGRPAMGKALALGTPLATPLGWTTMGDVAVGDFLLGADGRPTAVVAATEVMVDRPCYEVEFDDGSVIVADAQHQWLTATRVARKRAQERSVRTAERRAAETTVHTTEQLAATLRCKTADRRLNHCVANTAPIELPEASLPLPPYALGVWLGDGHSASARYTSDDPEIAMHIEDDGLDVVPREGRLYSLRLRRPQVVVPTRECVVCGQEFAPATTQVRTCGKSCGGRAKTLRLSPLPAPSCPTCGGRTTSGFRPCAKCIAQNGSVPALLRALGVLGNKHIPAQYLRASVGQRRDLLAGLLDTDGTVSPTGAVQITLTNHRLALDVRELVVSLGYRSGWQARPVRGRHPDSSTGYVITFSPAENPFRLERKRLVFKDRVRARSLRVAARFIVDVRRVESVPVRCVEVDNDSHLYLAGHSMIPTHNSTLGLDIARAASIKHHQTSVLFSLEMSKHEITMRLLSAEARIPLQYMRTGRMGDDDWVKLTRRLGEMASAPLYIDDSPNLTMMEIRAKARRLKQRNDLRLVIVDYLQLMTSHSRVENRQQEVSQISRSMKLLAKELEVPVIALSQLNRGPEQRTDKKPQLSDLRECLAGDTVIARRDTGERVPVRELAGCRDVPIWSVDERLRVVPAVMSDVWSTGTREVWRLTLASGRTITATANHPLRTVHGWCPVEALSVGDFLATTRASGAPDSPTAWPDEHVIMLAHLLGDGCVSRSPVYYCSRDEACLRAVEEAADAFGVNTTRTPGRGVTYVHFPMRGNPTHGVTNPLYDWLRNLDLYGKRAPEKRAPSAVHRFNNRQVKLFLRHLWATDGSVTVSGSGRVRVFYATTSRALADDVQALLLRLGIGGRLRRAASKTEFPIWSVDVSGRDDLLTFLTEVGVHGERGERCREALDALRDSRSNPNVDIIPAAAWDYVRKAMRAAGVTTRRLAELLEMSFCGSALYKAGLSRARMARVAAAVPEPFLRDLATSDVRWDRITAIEPAGSEEVFDAHVPGTHSFLANDVVSHNSGAIEQDADVVILLHREDVYERESPRAGEADLIVAKHRNGPTDTLVVAFQGHYSRFVDMAPG